MLASASMRKLAPFLLAVAACGAEPAPEDVDGLARWFWLNFEKATPDEIADSVEKLDAAIAAYDLPLQNTLSLLKAGDTDHVGKAGAELANAFGLIAVTSIPCSLDRLEPVVYALKQNENHPTAYLTYERRYASDFDAYKARTAEFLDWTVLLSTDPTGLGHEFQEKLKGGLRRTARVEGRRFGPILLGRTVLQEPATFKDPDAGYFRQDYQVDVWFERKPGETIHLFGAWRELKFSVFSVEDLQGSQLDAFVKGDTEKGAICSR